MQHQIKSVKKKFSILALAALLVVAGSFTPARQEAHPHAKKTRGGNANGADVTYAGTRDGHPLFHLRYENTKGSRFSVSITDADGYILFQSAYNDPHFDRFFQIADPDFMGSLTFVIRDFQDHSEQSFEINTNTRLVEDIEVKEIK